MSIRLGILGASGQVGTELLRLGAEQKTNVSAPSSTEVDVRDAVAVERWINSSKPELIVNCAAYTAVDRAEDERDVAFAVNGIAPGIIGGQATRARIPVFHISTDYVFSGDKAGPYVEEDPTGPINVYGRSKLQGEHALFESTKDAFVMRVSWVFSAHGRNFVRAILDRCRKAAEIDVVNDQLGAPCSARSIADAIWQLAPAVIGGGQHLCHFATPPFVAWHGFAEAIVSRSVALGLLLNEIPVRPIPTSAYPTKARRPANSCLSAQRIYRDWGIVESTWPRELDMVLRELAQLSMR